VDSQEIADTLAYGETQFALLPKCKPTLPQLIAIAGPGEGDTRGCSDRESDHSPSDQFKGGVPTQLEGEVHATGNAASMHALGASL